MKIADKLFIALVIVVLLTTAILIVAACIAEP